MLNECSNIGVTTVWITVIHDCYFWALIQPLNVFVFGGWSNRQNQALHAWGYVWVFLARRGQLGRTSAQSTAVRRLNLNTKRGRDETGKRPAWRRQAGSESADTKRTNKRWEGERRRDRQNKRRIRFKYASLEWGKRTIEGGGQIQLRWFPHLRTRAMSQAARACCDPTFG